MKVWMPLLLLLFLFLIFFVIMVCPIRLSHIVVLLLFLPSGWLFSLLSKSSLPPLPPITLKQMDRPNTPLRLWKPFYVTFVIIGKMTGPTGCLWPNSVLRIPPLHLPSYHPSSLGKVFTLEQIVSPPLQKYLQWMRILLSCRRFNCLRVNLFAMPRRSTLAFMILILGLPPSTSLMIWFGCLGGTSLPLGRLQNLITVVLVRFGYIIWLAPMLCAYTWVLLTLDFILSSMYLWFLPMKTWPRWGKLFLILLQLAFLLPLLFEIGRM